MVAKDVNPAKRILLRVSNGLATLAGKPKRTDVPLGELDDMVREAVVSMLDEGVPFTAFEITNVIRVAHPDLNIPHVDGVRELVHMCANDFNLPRRVSAAKGGATLFFPPEADPDGLFEEDEEDEE